MVMTIATAATQQASASEEINANVEQIAKITQESASGAREAEKAVQELSSLATDLQTIVSKFHLGDNGRGHSSSFGGNASPGLRNKRPLGKQEHTRDEEEALV